MIKTQSGSVFGKLKNKHYKMERFCVLFCAFFAVIVLLFISAFKQKRDRSKVTLSSQIMYTAGSTFSLTGNGVEFQKVYKNTDGTKVFLLANVENNMDGMSTNASDYQLLMTGYNGEKLHGIKPSAAIYIFGESGYMGFYFESPLGFESEICDIVVRNTRVTTAISANEVHGGYSDASFAKFNQMQFFVNLGGTDAPVAEFLNKDVFAYSDMYADLMNLDSFNTLKESIDSSLKQMHDEYKNINEDLRWFDSHNIYVTNYPFSVINDKIVSDETLTLNNPMYHSVEMDSMGEDDFSMGSDYSGWNNIDAEFEPVFEYNTFEEEDKMYLVTDYVFSGGVQYNHQDVALTDQFYQNLIPFGKSFNEWKKSLTTSDYDEGYNIDLHYYYKDSGFELRDDDNMTEQYRLAVARYRTNLETSFKHLITLKSQYQTNQLVNLITILHDNVDAVDMFTVNSSEDMLIVY